MDDETNEYVDLEIDEDSETLAFLLTLIVRKVRPDINPGKTYEAYLKMIVQLMNGYPMTETDAARIGQKILDSTGAGFRGKH